MVIENNPIQKKAMEAFHRGDRQEGLRLQEEFASQFREEYGKKDHCSCKKACRYHGNCKECVAIHRAHQEHVPNCMRPIINQKLRILSELTEHTLAKEIEPPKEILRKEEEKLELIFPSPEWKAEILDYKKEFLENGETLHGTAGLQESENFETWYQSLLDNHREETVRKGMVPASTYLGVEVATRRLVGFIDIRHQLNSYLLQYGGHIGYSVRKSERKQGYGSKLLELALQECRSLGMDRVLITCDSENTASQKTILRNGGVLENEVSNAEKIMKRYWIRLS